MDLDFENNLRHKDALGKFVKVLAIDNRVHEGWLKCINPIGGDLILVTFDENFTRIKDTVLIFGSKYKSLEIIKDADEKIKTLLKEQKGASSSATDVTDRKKRLITWIKKHRLPVSENEDGSLMICDSVIISAPYEMINCSSLNSRVLKNIRELVRRLPEGEIETHVCEAD